MERIWVRGPQGDYLVVGGRAGLVANATEPLGKARSRMFFWGLPLLAGRMIQRRGRLVVRWRDFEWTWETANGGDALRLVPHVVELLRSGDWVPVEMPPPSLPGAGDVSARDLVRDVFG